MSTRLAVHVPTHQLPEFQRAARLLLHSPLVTSSDADGFALIRRWEPVLRNEFSQKLGYRLDVGRSAARLLRKPSALCSTRPARLKTGRPLSRWAYVYFCLVLAALEEPGTQVLASELADRIQQASRGDSRLQLDPTEYSQRKAFRDALKYLEQLGVLTVRDGDVEQLGLGPGGDDGVDTLVKSGQVLLDIDRDAAAMCLVASPSILREVSEVADFITETVPATTEALSRLARQRLNRRLVDQPAVLVDELSTEESELAWRNRRREADNIGRLTGCQVEVRSEGMALIDTTIGPIGRKPFPGTDSVSHAALLWLDRLIAAIAPAGPETPTPRPRARVPLATATACWDEIFEAYSSRFGKDARAKPDQFAAHCLNLLTELGLARQTDDEIEICAAALRFRAQAQLVGDSASTEPLPDQKRDQGELW